MPVASSGDHEREVDRERSKEKDRDDRGERGNSKSQQKSSSSKTKDLSHVPCKFFKVGSCTAGSSCPFSHSVVEPGGQKDVCAWFVKGNCKFGHKCALAHVLPGQSMSMDRKNKKAAQVAAGGGKNDSKSSGRAGKRDTQGRPPALMSLKASITPSAPAPAIKDTDFASLGVLDETSKLPSAPAHGKQPSTSQSGPDIGPSATKNPSSGPNETAEEKEAPSTPAKPVSPSLPVSSPRRADRDRSPASGPPNDFGPIGSPPRSINATSPHSRPHPVSRLNGDSFSPGTSPSARNNVGTPTNHFLSASPFSAPGTQTGFNISERSGMGIATSLGSGFAMDGGSSRNKPTWGSQVENEDNIATRRALAMEANAAGNTGDGGDDLEDFLPSSLTDLLTPEERSRRMSRSNSGQGAAAQGDPSHPVASPSGRTLGVPLAAPSGSGAGAGNGNGHRYSRSVPAPSLLGDISSIWSNNPGAANGGLTPNVGSPLSGGLPSSPGRMGGLGNGTPSSFTQGNSGFGGRSAFDPLGDEFGAGSPPNFLAPSNASAAFLPGIHSQYLKSKQGQSSGLGRGIRNASSPIFPSSPGTGTLQSSLAAATSRLTGSGSGYATPSSSFVDHGLNGDNLQRPNLLSSNSNTNVTRPIPSSHLTPNNDDPQLALSPASRALQAHAPGQSLPQGLAAGYSRIHALPPPLPLASPGSTGMGGSAFSVSPGVTGAFNIGPYGSNNGYSPRTNEWGNTAGGGFSSLYSGAGHPNAGLGGPPGLSHPIHTQSMHANAGDLHTGAVGAAEGEAMSKLSYSAAAAKGAPAGSVVSPQKSRWGGQQGAAAGTLSPLSKPVATGDDDDLFTLDA
ncbi:hypothetical protein V5O48_008199 [Marasmius crinis-equi]|uniref:C3H1-type domain-containing protein n=1 Tax=Marasmius crinis-equi TaxID=585013 RepID=A0ABR3FEM3_9AGAR